MPRILAFMLLAALAANTGCSRFAGKDRADTGEPEEVRIPVAVADAEVATMAERVTVTGTIRADRQADVSAQISARVLEVKVREGDAVRQGQVLIRLDPKQAQAQVAQASAGAEAARARLAAARARLDILEKGAREEERAIARSRLEQAQAALRTAEADLERLRGLFQQGAVSRQQLDAAQMAYDTARTNRDAARQSLDLIEKGARPEEIDAARKEAQAAQATVVQAEAALAIAQEMLSYATIRSPLTGVVYHRGVHQGEITTTMGGPPLLRLADIAAIYYEATVPERAALRVEAGQRVEVTIQGDGDRLVPGTVERVVPVADPMSRDFLVRITIDGDAALPKPGMFARGAIIVSERPDVVVVPKTAIVQREGKPVVFVIADDTAEARPVIVGITDRTRAEIVGGIEPWEKVVVSGAESLQHGSAVQVRALGGD